MTIEQNALDALARIFFNANGLLTNAAAKLRHSNPVGAAESIEEARRLVWTGYKDAQRAGAARPEGVPASREVPLHLLDTPTNRRLLDALVAVHEAAAAVDRERGIDPNDGVAAIYESRAADKRDEIFGTVGAGRE